MTNYNFALQGKHYDPNSPLARCQTSV